MGCGLQYGSHRPSIFLKAYPRAKIVPFLMMPAPAGLFLTGCRYLLFLARQVQGRGEWVRWLKVRCAISIPVTFALTLIYTGMVVPRG